MLGTMTGCSTLEKALCPPPPEPVTIVEKQHVPIVIPDDLLVDCDKPPKLERGSDVGSVYTKGHQAKESLKKCQDGLDAIKAYNEEAKKERAKIMKETQ